MGAGYDGGDGETPWVGWVLMKGGSARWVADAVAGEKAAAADKADFRVTGMRRGSRRSSAGCVGCGNFEGLEGTGERREERLEGRVR